MAGLKALSEGPDTAGGYRWEWGEGDVTTALAGGFASIRLAATSSEARRFAPEQAKCDLVRPARAERTDRRVAEAHRLHGEVGVGLVG